MLVTPRFTIAFRSNCFADGGSKISGRRRKIRC
jgi:hypothetical protein